MNNGSINRNIVECKADTMRKLLVDIGVLIETLWNVKRYAANAGAVGEKVLIETLWNVKN